MLICAAVNVMVCYTVGMRREIVMCAAFSFMVFYRGGETKGNAVVCCF